MILFYLEIPPTLLSLSLPLRAHHAFRHSLYRAWFPGDVIEAR